MAGHRRCQEILTILAALLPLSWIPVVKACADDDEQSNENITISAEILLPEKVQPPRIRITATIADGWHVFSITQKPGGPKRTRIEITESKEFKLVGPWAATPDPSIKHYDDIWPKLPIEEHERRVTWTAPLEMAAGADPARIAIAGRVQAQCCKQLCIDVTLPFEARRERSGRKPQ